MPSPQPIKAEVSDRFGRSPRYLRLSVTGRCNFRCVYCAPEAEHSDPAPAHALTDEELIRVVGVCTRLGIRKVRFTGGEPLLRSGLPALMKRAANIPGVEEIALTTNAYLLERHLDELVDAGLRSVNISCDTLRRDRFRQITRRRGLGRVLRAIDAALAHPRIERVKLNMVVMRGINDDEVADFLSFCDAPKIEVRFIEFMPTADVAYSRNLLVSEAEVRERIGVKLEPVTNGDPTAPARLWTLPDRPGRVGFISTMTHKFCNACTRLRITADGRVANCLFSESLLDLKALLRNGCTDEEMFAALVSYWQGKAAGHRLDDPTFIARPSMIAVGG